MNHESWLELGRNMITTACAHHRREANALASYLSATPPVHVARDHRLAMHREARDVHDRAYLDLFAGTRLWISHGWSCKLLTQAPSKLDRPKIIN